MGTIEQDTAKRKKNPAMLYICFLFFKNVGILLSVAAMEQLVRLEFKSIWRSTVAEAGFKEENLCAGKEQG